MDRFLSFLNPLMHLESGSKRKVCVARHHSRCWALSPAGVQGHAGGAAGRLLKACFPAAPGGAHALLGEAGVGGC